MIKQRNCGIDLLRIVATFMICVLHVLNRGGILKSVDGITYYVYLFLEVICLCSVNCYALISGYISETKEIKFSKIIKLWFQVLFYSFLLTNILNLLFLKTFNIKEIIKSMLPLMTDKFWYFTAYVPLFFFIPYINKLLDSIDTKGLKLVFCFIVLYFSLYGFVTDNYLDGGYSFLWLLLMYILGYIIKKLGLFSNVSKMILVLVFVFSSFVTAGTVIVFDSGIFISYISPTIVVNGICLLLLFSRININNKFIDKISTYTFGIYIFQCSEYIWNYVIKDGFVFVANYQLFKGITFILLLSSVIFVGGLVVDYIRNVIFKLLKIDILFINIDNLIKKQLNNF